MADAVGAREEDQQSFLDKIAGRISPPVLRRRVSKCEQLTEGAKKVPKKISAAAGKAANAGHKKVFRSGRFHPTNEPEKAIWTPMRKFSAVFFPMWLIYFGYGALDWKVAMPEDPRDDLAVGSTRCK